jgi:hypothetical protein
VRFALFLKQSWSKTVVHCPELRLRTFAIA